MKSIKRACEIVGGLTPLAHKLGVSVPTVSQWVVGRRPIPLDRCVDVERATGGQVTCEELRPDKAELFGYLRKSKGIDGVAADSPSNEPVTQPGAL